MSSHRRFTSLLIIFNTLFNISRAAGCIPTNVCLQNTAGSTPTSSRYWCDPWGDKYLYTFNNLDCFGIGSGVFIDENDGAYDYIFCPPETCENYVHYKLYKPSLPDCSDKDDIGYVETISPMYPGCVYDDPGTSFCIQDCTIDHITFTNGLTLQNKQCVPASPYFYNEIIQCGTETHPPTTTTTTFETETTKTVQSTTTELTTTTLTPNTLTARDDSATVPDGWSLHIDVKANDSDNEGDPFHVIAIINGPEYGLAHINPDDTVTYITNPETCREIYPTYTDVFQYLIRDARGAEDTAFVTVTVECATGSETTTNAPTTTASETTTETATSSESTTTETATTTSESTTTKPATTTTTTIPIERNCDCNGGMVQLTVQYIGECLSTMDITAYYDINKRLDEILPDCVFYDVLPGDQLTCTAPVTDGQFQDKLYFDIDCVDSNRRMLKNKQDKENKKSKENKQSKEKKKSKETKKSKESKKSSKEKGSSSSDKPSDSSSSDEQEKHCTAKFDTSCKTNIVGEQSKWCNDLKVISYISGDGAFCDETVNTVHAVINDEEAESNNHLKENINQNNSGTIIYIFVIIILLVAFLIIASYCIYIILQKKIKSNNNDNVIQETHNNKTEFCKINTVVDMDENSNENETITENHLVQQIR